MYTSGSQVGNWLTSQRHSLQSHRRALSIPSRSSLNLMICVAVRLHEGPILGTSSTAHRRDGVGAPGAAAFHPASGWQGIFSLSWGGDWCSQVRPKLTHQLSVHSAKTRVQQPLGSCLQGVRATSIEQRPCLLVASSIPHSQERQPELQAICIKSRLCSFATLLRCFLSWPVIAYGLISYVSLDAAGFRP